MARETARIHAILWYGVGLLLFSLVGIPVPCGGMVVSSTLLFLRVLNFSEALT